MDDTYTRKVRPLLILILSNDIEFVVSFRHRTIYGPFAISWCFVLGTVEMKSLSCVEKDSSVRAVSFIVVYSVLMKQLKNMRFLMIWLFCICMVTKRIDASSIWSHEQQDTLPKTMEIYRSDLSGLRLSRLDASKTLTKVERTTTRTTIEVRTNETRQRMVGFGASFLESGAMNLNALSEDKQDELLRLIFSDEGAKMSLMKVPMPCDDFCAAGPWYTYDDSPGDVHLVNFSVARDQAKDGVMTFVLRAKEYGFDGLVQSYMDYPPDWMLKGALPDDATVDPVYFDVLAQYYAKFVQAYAKENITISYLSLFNEPVDSYTNIDDADMARLLGKHVGPLFDRLGLRERTKLTYGGQATRQWANMHIQTIMKDPDARKYMDHFAYHGYDCQFNCTSARNKYDLIADVHNMWPDKEMLMTEVCYAYNGDDPNCTRAETLGNCTDWPRNTSLAPPLPRLDFEDGRIWGSRIVSDIAAGASGWIYWNLLLNMDGGPFQYSPQHNDGSRNLQQAAIHVSNATDTFSPTAVFWYLAHFSRFVRTNSRFVQSHVESASRPDPSAPEGTTGIVTAAFVDRNDAGTRITLQVLNNEFRDRNVTIYATSGDPSVGSSFSLNLSPVSITTVIWEL